MSEHNNDIFQLAKDLAKAERELHIERWVIADIGYYDSDRRFVVVHRYDMPRNVYERWAWVARWRAARLQCTMPKQLLSTYLSYYDKRSGLQLGVGKDLSKLIAAKAQVTKVERAIEAYINANKSSLFFDEATDEQLIAARNKLQAKREAVQRAEDRLCELINNNR